MSGDVVVVSGAGSGIGRTTAKRLASSGASVAVCDLDALAAGEAAAEISDAGGTAAAFPLDVADETAVRTVSAQVLAALGAPAAVLNVAGWNDAAPFLETTSDHWHRTLAVNLLGVMALSHAFLPAMVRAGYGRIVNVASDAGRVGSAGDTPYAAAKGGVIAFTKSLARETARHGICVNCVCPGPTDTPMLRRSSERLRAAVERTIPLGRVADPGEVAAVICFLASRDASYITGQVLSVSGGLTMAG
jgi:2-hydroxycyclohexanecarboxyl-CoA dehydrogenase